MRHFLTRFFTCMIVCVGLLFGIFDLAQAATYSFTITTTNLSAGDSVTFSIGAAGTFYIDCGNGSANSGTITKQDASNGNYFCNYPSRGGVKTIRIGGTATAYNSSYSVGAIKFTSPQLMASISGNLSTIFPYLGADLTQSPRFYQTFLNFSNLTSIPDTLFSGYTNGGAYMFSNTFSRCTGLTSIPENLFSFGNNNVSGQDYMFYSTFNGCTGLTSIPAGLFSHVTTSAPGMFSYTFAYDSGLTSIPENLFSFGNNNVSGQDQMFRSTFEQCTGLVSIPSGLFSRITTSGGRMFDSTFMNCTGLTSLPANLFSNLTTFAGSMFRYAFRYCTGLTGYIPPSMFSGLIANGVSASNMFQNTFDGSGLTTSCATYNKSQYITGYESRWNSKVSCGTEYTVTYACGDGIGTAPTTNTSAIFDGLFTPAANTCTGLSGYGSFAGWAVSGTNDVKPAGTAFTWNYNENKTFTAQWTANTVPLSWYNGDTQLTVPSNAQSCEYGGTMTLPSTPIAPETGLAFDGWTIKVIE